MASLQRRMLSKEDEKAVGEVEVRREDQDMINKFSRLHQRLSDVDEKLKAKIKEKEDFDDLATELELSDEDDKVPFKVGDSYFHISLQQAQEMLGTLSEQADEEVSKLEDNIKAVKAEMTQLKVKLYARFGKSINLEV